MRKANKEALTIAKHIHSFLTVYVPSLKNQSENTVRSHETAISLFIGYLEKEQDIDPSTLSGMCFSRNMIEKWILWLRNNRCCSPQTCNVRLGSLRAFLKYLGDKDVSMLHISQAASAISLMKTIKKKVVGMSKDAVKALMATPDTSTSAGRRDLALFVSIYATAARLDEILSLKVKHLHLDFKEAYATIVGKGSKIRSLYLLPKAAAHLKRYLLEYHGDAPNPEAYVFYSRNEGPFGKMSQAAVSKRLKLHAKASNVLCGEVPVTLHAHQLRHARASHWLEEGMNIVQISFLLGHEHLETTMVYLDVSIEQKSHALENLEDEYMKNLPKKWKGRADSLSAFCGVNPLSR
jgi:site-specific recombinase XerD